MDNRKHSGSKKNDSPMDTDSADSISTSTGQTSSTSNQQESQTQSNPRTNSLLMGMLARDSNETSTLRTETEIRWRQHILHNQSHPMSCVSQKSSSTDPSSLTDQTTQSDAPNPILKSLLIQERPNVPSTAINSTEVETVPGQNGSSIERSSEMDISDRARMLSDVETEIRPVVVKEEVSTIQLFDQDCFSANKNSPASSGTSHSGESSKTCSQIEPNPNMFQMPASKSQPQSTLHPLAQNGFSVAYKPPASSGASHSERSGDICSLIEPRPDRVPVYGSQAQILLQSVLTEIIQYNDENDRWEKFAFQFHDDSDSGAKRSDGDRGRDLMYYLAAANIDWHRTHGQNMQRTREMMIATYTLETYEMMTSVVRAALAHILTGRSSGDFSGFILNYVT